MSISLEEKEKLEEIEDSVSFVFDITKLLLEKMEEEDEGLSEKSVRGFGLISKDIVKKFDILLKSSEDG